MPFTHPTERSTCRAHGIIVSFFFCLPLDKAVALALDTHSGAQQLQAVCRRLKSLRVLLKENQNGLLVNAQTQDACTGAGESTSLPLTSDLAQLLQAEAYLPRFEKKKKKHSGETVGWPASPASIKACILYKDSGGIGHPLTTQRVTYAKN